MLVLVYVVVILLGIYIFFKRERRQGKPIPGPKGWPYIGVGLEVTQQNMFEKFFTYAKQYGDIFQVQVFGDTIIVLNSAETIRSAFTTDPYKKFMNDRRVMFTGQEFFLGCADMIFMDASSKHNELRKAYTKALRHFGEGRRAFEDTVQRTLKELIKELETFGTSEFGFQDVFKVPVEHIMSILIAGHKVETAECFDDLTTLEKGLDFFTNPITDLIMRTFPFMKVVPSVYRTQYRRLVAARQRFVNHYLEEAKATYIPGKTRGLLDFMLAEQSLSQMNGEDVLFTDTTVQATLLEAFIAGVNTTFITLNSIFLCLMHHRDYQVKIQEELDRVIGRDRPPTLDDKHNCPWIEAVVLETLRYIPTVPGLVPHECKSNTVFEGYDIPRNSMIIANIYYVGHDEKIWGDPWTFRPERFLDENGEIVSNDHPFRQSWLPFGIGRRQCIAESLARSRLFLFVATLLQRFTFEFPPGRSMSCDPRSGNFTVGVNLLVKPFYCRAVPRD